jgi:hypothetical protein
MRSWIVDRKQRYLLMLGAIAVMALLVDAPMVGITFIGDDALRANIDGWIAVHHSGLLAAFQSEVLHEDLYRGRFHPLFVALTLFEMHLVHQPLPLKLAQLFAVGLNVATLAFVVREILGSRPRALLAAFLAVFMLQIRNVSDATNGDALHLQLTFEFGMLAIGLLAYSLRLRGPANWASYGVSIVSFAIALLLYETSIPLILPLVLASMCARRSWAIRLALALPFVAVLVADVIAIIVVRNTWPPPPGAIYAPNFGVPYLYASVWQLVSTLPLIYELVDPQAVFHATNTYWPLAILAVLAVVCAIIGWMLTKKWRRSAQRRDDSSGVAVALTTGAALLAPALMVAASPVYQKVIDLALPYAPVYFQGFGLAIVLATCLPLRIVSPRATGALVAACATAFLVLFASNVVVAGQFDATKYARRTIVDGSIHRTASGIPSGAFVFLDNSYYWVNGNSYYGVNEAKIRGPLLWDSRYFYRLWSGRTWQTRPLSAENLSAGQDAYEIRSVKNAAGHGTLVVEHVRGRAEGPPALISARVFEHGTPPASTSVPAIAPAFAPRDFKVIASGPTWRVTEFRPRCFLLPDDALVGNAPSAAQIVYGDGFSVAETDGTMGWHWAGPRARLALVNVTGTAFVVELRAKVGTVGAARGTVNAIWPAGSEQIEISDDPRPIHLQVSLPARGQIAIQFSARAPNVALAGDSRDLRFRVIDASVTDDTGCTAKDARA